MVWLPFAQVVTIPILLLVGLIFLGLRAAGRLPTRETLSGLEKSLDDVSFRAFAVGIPFLTAGLWMGAFWAQEAWANYWGWDSKENSALITWLIYVVYIHLRMLGGYRGEKAMAVLAGGALSVFMTFQVFGYLPDSQKSLHRYTDDGVVPREGMSGGAEDESASVTAPEDRAQPAPNAR
jgi:ABC-type transport system involved in cytochrome c biogenesis permease subunit